MNVITQFNKMSNDILKSISNRGINAIILKIN